MSPQHPPRTQSTANRASRGLLLQDSNGHGPTQGLPTLGSAFHPPVLPVDPAGLPRDLTSLATWVVWRLEPKPAKPGEWTKVPYRAADPSKKASSTDPATWSTFAEAFGAYQFDPTLSGIGIVLHGEGLVGIDLDNALDESGHAKGWALAIVERLPGAYFERSPGGRGVRGFCRGELPPGRRKVKYQDGVIELYDDGRFLTLTGVAL